MSEFPNADQIAVAVVAACRLVGGDPLAIADKNPLRARHVACQALRDAYSGPSWAWLQRALAYTGHPAPTIKAAKEASWWRDEYVDEVVGELVGEKIEDDPEPETASLANSPNDAAKYPDGARFMFRNESGAWLHQSLTCFSEAKAYAWKGSARNLQVVKIKYRELIDGAELIVIPPGGEK